MPAGGAAAAEAAAVPDLAEMDAAVREQIEAARRALAEALEAGAAAPELAPLHGRLGQLYHAYDLPAAAAAAYDRALAAAPDEPQWLYLRAVVAQRQGRYEAAAADLSRLLEHGAAGAAAHLRLGQVERFRGHTEAAADALRRALELDPFCAAAAFELGQVALTAGRADEAVARFRRVLELQPAAEQAHFPLAQALLRLGRRDEARQHLERAAARQVSAGGRARCDDPWEAELARLRTGAAAHLARARHAALAGRPAEELAALRDAVAAAPDDAVSHQALGRALASRGETAAAVEEYRRAVELAPESSELAADLALLLLRSGAAEEAAGLYRQAVELRPADAAARLGLARAERAAGRPAEALAQLDALVAADAADAAVRIERATALSTLGRQGEAAAEAVRLADEGPPSSPAERLQLGVLLALLGDAARATGQLAPLAADEDAPDAVRGESHFHLGILALVAGRRERAVEHLETAVALAPDLVLARRALDRLQP
jgi:tetratricopeptide (TPR) repeat protein